MSEKDLKLKIKELTDLTEKQAKRIKLLTKRIKKLEEENIDLCEEIDTIDAVIGSVPTSKAEGCPKCNSSLTKLTLPNGQKQVVCDNVEGCSYRRKE